MAERSKARVCSRSPVGIAGSNPAEGMGVCVCVLYSKDKRHSQDNQDKVVVQMKYREQKKILLSCAKLFFSDNYCTLHDSYCFRV